MLCSVVYQIAYSNNSARRLDNTLSRVLTDTRTHIHVHTCVCILVVVSVSLAL